MLYPKQVALTIADPGAEVVAIAQKKGYRVVPLVGPSSILMAIIASGSFNGQEFCLSRLSAYRSGGR